MKRLLFLLTMVMGLAVVPQAQAVTLEELQRAAVANRDVVKKYELSLEQGRQGVREARGNMLPSLNAGYTLTQLDEDNLPYEYQSNDAATVSLKWNLFAGLADKYGLDSAEVLRESKKYQLKGIRQDVLFQVALKYLDVYRNREYLGVAEKALDLYKDRYRQVELKVQVGMLTKSDRLKVKVEMDNAAQETSRARAQLLASLNELSRITGQQVQLETLNFDCFKVMPGKGGYADYEGNLLEKRSEVQALKMAREAASYQAKAARAAYLPRFDVGVAYTNANTNDHFYGDPSAFSDEWRTQATLSINLFDGFKSDARLQQARLEEKKYGHDLTELEDDLKVRLKNTLLDLGVAFENLETARTSEKEAEENLRVTDLAFKQGVASSTDVLDSIYYYSRGRFNVIEAHRQVFGSYYQLQRLIEGFADREGA